MFIRELSRKFLLDLLGFIAEPSPGIHILNGYGVSWYNPKKRGV